MKKILFDSSTLISLSSSCLFNAVGEMFLSMGVKGVISSGVELESIINPLKIKRFELNAVRIRNGLDIGWLEKIKIEKEWNQEVQDLMGEANKCFLGPNGPLTVIHLGEVEALILTEKIPSNILAVDERTTRMIIEEPERLRKLLRKRNNISIKRNKNLSDLISSRFSSLRFVRSSELVALAYEKGFLEKEIGPGKKALEAALYALKFNGCALGSSEIEKFLRGTP